MRLLVLATVLVGVGAGCRGHADRIPAAKQLDAMLIARARELLPELDRLSGGGGGGGSDGAYSSQYDRRLETTKAVAAERHKGLLKELAATAREWLEGHGFAIRARGTTGDDETLDRACYRYEADGIVGWVALDGIRNEAGGFTLLITITEHVD